MKPTDLQKVEKLMCRVQKLIVSLEETRDIETHRRVNQFYYMEKSEEMRFLLGYRKEIEEKLLFLNGRIDDCALEVFQRWKKDVRCVRNMKSDEGFL